MIYRSGSGSRPGGGQGHGGSRVGYGGEQRREQREESPTIDVSGVKFGERPAADLFDIVAAAAALKVSEASQDKNKASQLRRFYDELVMWHERIGKRDEAFVEAEPYIRMMKAKVAYSKGRGHVDANFAKLFGEVIDQCRSAATLRQAKLFMEAFMAFYKVHRKS